MTLSAAQSQYRKATYPAKQAPHHAANSVSLKAVLTAWRPQVRGDRRKYTPFNSCENGSTK